MVCLWKRKIEAFANLKLKESCQWGFDTRRNELGEFDKEKMQLMSLERKLAPSTEMRQICRRSQLFYALGYKLSKVRIKGILYITLDSLFKYKMSQFSLTS